MNSSVSIEEHMRSKSRTITTMNMLKFFVRMVSEPHKEVFVNVESEGVLIWDHEEKIHFYLSCLVLFGFYWSLSDWFYYDRDHELVSWNGVLRVFWIDLSTNWIKFMGEIVNCILFLMMCIVIAVPLTVFIVLRLILCPCFFGYNNSGLLICN